MNQKVSFKVEGKKVIGILATLKNKPKTAVLMLHGFKGNKKEHGRFPKLAKALLRKNISSLMIDMRGTGESEGKFRDMTLQTEKKDAIAAIKFLKKRGYTKIGLLGLSLGGLIALLADAEQNIDAMVLWAPSIYFSGKKYYVGKEEKLREQGHITVISHFTGKHWDVGEGLFESAEKVNRTKLLKKIRCPVLILHGDRDVNVPLKISKKSIKILRCQKKLKVIPGADHYFLDRIDLFINPTIKWFIKWLR